MSGGIGGMATPAALLKDTLCWVEHLIQQDQVHVTKKYNPYLSDQIDYLS